MAIRKISSRDDDRVILTETLPYERPFRFSNDFLYLRMKRKGWDTLVKRIQKISSFKSNRVIPLIYTAATDSNGVGRQLSIPHPFAQIKAIEFYRRFQSSIIAQSSRSPYSIRTQQSVARFKNPISDDSDALDDILPTSLVPRNFFKVGPFDLIAKFYRSNMLRDIELRHRYRLQVDVKKCFYSIYTHSVTWAIYGKEKGKEVRHKNVFASAFDTLMQDLNWQETYGIVVGPEISRIFADIILGGIDVRLHNDLQQKGIRQNHEYIAYRYVDDYSFYSNDLDILDSILDKIRILLLEFKLFVNEEKTKVSSSPFSSDVQRLERDIQTRIRARLNNLESTQVDSGQDMSAFECKIYNPNRWSSATINEIRYASNINRVSSDVAASTAFIKVYQYLNRLIDRALKESFIERNEGDLFKALSAALQVIFYFYQANPKSSATVKLSKAIIRILKLSNASLQSSINRSISVLRSQGLVTIEFLITSKDVFGQCTNICTLITSLGYCSKIIVDTPVIRNFYSLLLKESGDYCYFAATSYIQNYHNDVQSGIDFIGIRKVISSLITKPSDLMKSSLFMLLFDLLACPYLDMGTKQKVAARVQLYKSGDHDGNLAFYSATQGYPFFFGWANHVDLEEFAESMEWRSVY